MEWLDSPCSAGWEFPFQVCRSFFMWIVGSNQKELHRGGLVNTNALTGVVVRCAGVDKAALYHHFQSEFPFFTEFQRFCSFQLPTPWSRASQSSCHQHISSASSPALQSPGQSFSLPHPKRTPKSKVAKPLYKEMMEIIRI